MGRPGPREHTEPHRRALYREALALIATDCGPFVSIDSVARSIATSRRQLQRAFSDIGGTTFSAQLFVVRMQTGAALLLETPASVREIAIRVGYLEPSQFTKAFRRFYGVTPTELRRRQAARGLRDRAPRTVSDRSLRATSAA